MSSVLTFLSNAGQFRHKEGFQLASVSTDDNNVSIPDNEHKRAILSPKMKNKVFSYICSLINN